MKKNLSKLFISLVLILGGQASWAQTFTVGDFSYTVTDAGATVSVSKTTGISGNVVIPTSVSNGGVTYAVTSVANKGFESTDITGVTIPASVTVIGSSAFASCANLVDIRIEDSDVALQMTVGYYGSFKNSNADKTVYIGRELDIENSARP